MFDALFRYIVDGFRNIPSCISIGLLIILFVGGLLLFAILGAEKGGKLSAGVLLAEYLFLILCLTVFTRKTNADQWFDFSPFWSYHFILGGDKSLLMQTILNIVTFIPIGVLLRCVFTRIKWWIVLLISFSFSFLIETLQFILRCGFAEFDDVFHNVLGCMFGYGLYVVIAHIVKTSSNKRAISSK